MNAILGVKQEETSRLCVAIVTDYAVSFVVSEQAKAQRSMARALQSLHGCLFIHHTAFKLAKQFLINGQKTTGKMHLFVFCVFCHSDLKKYIFNAI